MLPKDAFQKAKLHADRAIALDSKIPEGHVAKASVMLMYEWKWQEGYEALKEAKRTPAVTVQRRTQRPDTSCVTACAARRARGLSLTF